MVAKMKVKSIAECFGWSILQYFWPALSYNWSWKPFFGLFESGCFTQVLLYMAAVIHLDVPYGVIYVSQYLTRETMCIGETFLATYKP